MDEVPRAGSSILGPLFLNHAAGDARTGISRRVGFVIIGAGVDDDRRACRLKQRYGTVAERHRGIQQRSATMSIGCDFQIQQVAVVRTFRIILSVLFPRWIEMSTRRLEIGAFAFSYRMNVDAVRSRRKLRDVHINTHGACSRCKSSRADFLSGGVDDVRVRGLRHLRG